MIEQGLSWWTEGLATAFSHVERAFSRPRQFCLNSQHRPFVLQPIEKAGTSPQFPINISEAPSAPADEVLQQTRGSVVEIVVPPIAILEGKLEPLPAESRPYIESIVRHQIAKLFPWRSADVLYAVSTKDRDDGKIEVMVQATPRNPIASLLESIKAYGASEICIVAGTDGNAERSVRIPLPINEDGQNSIDRVRHIARYVIVAMLLFVVAAVGWTSFSYWSLSDDVAALDQAIAAREALNRRGADANSARHDDLASRKEQTAAAVAVLEALSAVLPDDTYLTDMSLESGRLRISGISGRATELVPLLENSGRFKNASFYAPTTRIPGRGGDRFSIEASVIP